jgi:hypothetical protein
MTKKPENDIEALRAWAARALHGVEECHIFNMLWSPSILDIRREPAAALQFAAAVLLDKPIYVLVPEGEALPPRVQLLATGVEYYTRGDADSLKRATIRLLSKATGIEVRQ